MHASDTHARTGRRTRRLVAVAAVAAVASGLLLTLAGTNAAGVAIVKTEEVVVAPTVPGIRFVDDVSNGDDPSVMVEIFPATGGAVVPGHGIYVVDTATDTWVKVPDTSPDTIGWAISGDGGTVLYVRESTGDVLVHDLDTGTTTSVAVNDDEVAADDFSNPYGISDDGRYVSFTSDATNLVPGDTNAVRDVFVRDLVDGTTERVSRTIAGGQRTGEDCADPALSNDGNVVAYVCFDVDEDRSAVYRYNRTTGTTTLVSDQTPAQFPFAVTISGDGSTVAFLADVLPLGSDFPGALWVEDVATGQLAQAPVTPIPGSFFASLPDLSTDGRLVSATTLFFDPDTGDFLIDDVLVHDRQTGATASVVDATGTFSIYGVLGSGRSLYYSAETGAALVSRLLPFTEPTPSAPAGYVPLDETVRVVDGVPVGARGTTYADLSGFLPDGVTAAAVNVTLAGVTSRTYVSVCPGGTPPEDCQETSTVNPYRSRDVANLAFPQVGEDQFLQIYNNEGSVTVYVDLVGYFTTQAPGDTLDFLPSPAPERDDEVLTLTGGTSDLVTLDDVPAGAQAAAVRVTAAGVTGNTYLSTCAGDVPDAQCDDTSALNANRRDTSNLAVVPVGGAAGTDIKIYNNVGRAIVYTDVVGYFVPEGDGSRYVALPPTRVLERQPLGAGLNVTRSYAAALPAAATGVAANVTTAGATATTYVSVCPGGTPVDGCRETSTVNPYVGQDTASSTLVGVGPDRSLLYFNNLGTTLLFTDVQGYFAPAAP